MKLKKRIELEINGIIDCRNNVYNPPVDEKERAIYHRALDVEYQHILYRFNEYYEDLVDPGNYL